ncbi:MAG: tetratricopeptide repeat protein, partial [Verrucomicrobiota bacterium]
QKDYDGVLKLMREYIVNHGEETEPKVLIMSGNSYRFKEDYADAIRDYSRLEILYQDKPEAQEASYQKLLCLFKTEDLRLEAHVDQYVSRMKSANIDSPNIDMAYLLKGERSFGQKKYQEAADAYANIRVDKVDERYRSQIHYKKGWAMVEAKRWAEGRDALTAFVATNPPEDQLPRVYAKRAQCYRGLKEFPHALKDFEKIVEANPKSREGEFALHQSGLIHVQMRDYDRAIETFDRLLETFPETKAAGEARYWKGASLYEKKEYAKAVPELRKARDADPDAYLDKASMKIILSLHYLQNPDNLSKEIDLLLKRRPETKISPDVLTQLGYQFFEREDFERAARYLEASANREEPSGTNPLVWNYLGRSQLRTGSFAASIQAFDFYLEGVKSPSQRARVLLNKATALSKLEKYDEGKTCAEEALTLEKTGQTYALAWILLGDIAMAKSNYEEAAMSYIIPSQMFQDPEVTPRALQKAAKAFEKLGEPDKAEDALKELRKNYPGFFKKKAE